MMRGLKGIQHRRWLILACLLALVTAVAWPWAIDARSEGLAITVSAENKSTADTPFCGIGGGLVGDTLRVNVFTDLSGVTTGTATFRPATGPAVTLNIDTVSTFVFGGVVLIDSSNGNSVALWLDEASAPVHVNVELPRGCETTQSTFTAGADELSVLMAVR